MAVIRLRIGSAIFLRRGVDSRSAVRSAGDEGPAEGELGDFPGRSSGDAVACGEQIHQFGRRSW